MLIALLSLWLTSNNPYPLGISQIYVDGMPVAMSCLTVDRRPLNPKPLKLRVCLVTGQEVALDLSVDLMRVWPNTRWDLTGEDDWVWYVIEQPAIYGDVNNDGFCNFGDMMYAVDCISGTDGPRVGCWHCDYDRDGDVDESDVRLIKGARQ